MPLSYEQRQSILGDIELSQRKINKLFDEYRHGKKPKDDYFRERKEEERKIKDYRSELISDIEEDKERKGEKEKLPQLRHSLEELGSLQQSGIPVDPDKKSELEKEIARIEEEIASST